MRISAYVKNSFGSHEVSLETNGNARKIIIEPKPEGFGSSANGGELLFLALATCYCNDIYREAAKRGIAVERVEVTVEGEFGAAGEPAQNIAYNARVHAKASREEIETLMRETDALAEIQNTLRRASEIKLTNIEAFPA